MCIHLKPGRHPYPGDYGYISSPESAKEIVYCLCAIGVDKITEAIYFEQVNPYENGMPGTKPCNATSTETYVFPEIVVVVLAYVIFVVSFIFDDISKTDDEIERCLELAVIGDISNAVSTKCGKYYYRHYGKYGYCCGQRNK